MSIPYLGSKACSSQFRSFCIPNSNLKSLSILKHSETTNFNTFSRLKILSMQTLYIYVLHFTKEFKNLVISNGYPSGFCANSSFNAQTPITPFTHFLKVFLDLLVPLRSYPRNFNIHDYKTCPVIHFSFCSITKWNKRRSHLCFSI